MAASARSGFFAGSLAWAIVAQASMPSSSFSVRAKPSAVSASSTRDGDAALGGFLLQQALEGLVAVAVDFGAAA